MRSRGLVVIAPLAREHAERSKRRDDELGVPGLLGQRERGHRVAHGPRGPAMAPRPGTTELDAGQVGGATADHLGAIEVSERRSGVALHDGERCRSQIRALRERGVELRTSERIHRGRHQRAALGEPDVVLIDLGRGHARLDTERAVGEASGHGEELAEQPRFRRPRPRSVDDVSRVPRLCLGAPGGIRLRQRELAHDPGHTEAPRRGAPPHLDERSVGEHVHPICGVGPAEDRLGALERELRLEARASEERVPIDRVERLPRPPQRGRHARVAFGRVAVASPQEPELVTEAGDEPLEAERGEAARRQLDGQRAAFERLTHLSHEGRARVDLDPELTGAGDEHLDPERRVQRTELHLDLARHAQRLA